MSSCAPCLSPLQSSSSGDRSERGIRTGCARRAAGREALSCAIKVTGHHSESGRHFSSHDEALLPSMPVGDEENNGSMLVRVRRETL